MRTVAAVAATARTWSMSRWDRGLANTMVVGSPASRRADRIGGSGSAASGISLAPYTLIGTAMFLNCCSPRESNTAGSLLPTAARTISETQMPPGSANVCRRAATFTPSPYT